jgi:translation initiation factor 1
MAGLFAGTPLHRPVTCEQCGKPLAPEAPPGSACACPRDAAGRATLPRDQRPRIRREKRRGKWNTIIADLDPAATDLNALLKTLRSSLGTGGGLTGAAEAPEIVIQGDHRDAVVAMLRDLGYQAKPAGG